MLGLLGRHQCPTMSLCQFSAFRRQLSVLCKVRGIENKSGFVKQHCVRLATSSGTWPPKLSSNEVRNIFLNYFISKEHKFVQSSSVVAKKNEGSYFINAGMNQFKPIFLGQVDANSEMGQYRRVTNSQKCIRVGGKHNDLDEVGKDTYHHTFFEMLGSWSFGQYFKSEACNMAWELLTKVYRIPPKHLYVTYFGGDEAAGLVPDMECRDIWLQIGVPANRVIPKGMEDNFWDMGFTGPCGPCTEIHFDHQGRPDATHLFNMDHPEVVEIWNLVFMQYERRENGELLKLPQHHVDTGMGLERLTAVLNGTTSNYATDLFIPLFSYLRKNGKHIPPYGDRCGSADFGGIDTAYRIVADHARMFTVALSDGLLPSRRHVGFRLRTVMHRAFKVAHQVLGVSPGKLSGLVPIITDSLGEAYPLLAKEQSQIIDWIDHTERQYLQTVEQSRKMLHKALKKYNNSSAFMTGEQIHEIVEGRFGQAVNLDTLIDLSEDYNIQLNLNAYRKILESYKTVESSSCKDDETDAETLDAEDVRELAERNIPCTVDDMKYLYEKKQGSYVMAPCESTVLALQSEGEFSSIASEGASVGIILNQTSFYAESGGQIADTGKLVSSSGSVVDIEDVQKYGNYILHIGKVSKGPIKVGETLQQQVDLDKRVGCMCGHTATHIVNYALERTLGGVIQQGSNVYPHKLSFDFSCRKPLVTDDDIMKVEEVVQSIIQASLPVHKAEVPFSVAQTISGLRTVPDALYPSNVRVVSVGTEVDKLLDDPDKFSSSDNSVELCGGTHVDNSIDVGTLVITHFGGRGQGVKSLTAVTGPVALQAIENGKTLAKMVEDLKNQVAKKINPNQWDKKLADILKFSTKPISKVDKERILGSLKHTQGKVLNEQKKVQKRNELRKEIYEVFNSCSDPFVVASVDFGKTSELYKVLGKMQLFKPMILISLNQENRKSAMGICYVPPEKREEVSQRKWAARVCEIMGGKYEQPKDKFAKKFLPDSLVLTFNFSDKASLNRTLNEARKYVHNVIKFKL